MNASAAPAGSVDVTSAGLPDLATAPPVEFEGPGDAWSPETLLCAALVDCFILTFRAVARAAADHLVPFLEVGGQAAVDHEADVGLVDAHAEGDRRDDHLDVVTQESLLRVPPDVRRQARVIGRGVHAAR